MNWVDGAVIGIVLISVLVSVLRGFVREVLSLLAWIAAFWVASAYAVPASELLAPYVTIESARVVLAFVGVLIVTLIAVGIIN
ncbi:MAG: CvpA family protein, partial [Gammaproteobacteria bacterium]